MIPAIACAAVTALFVTTQAEAADTPDAQAESVRGVGTFERDPIGIELDRLIELPFDLAEDGDYDPDETRPPILSTFTVFPTFEVDLIATDNIFRSEANERFDLITIYRPILEIQSDWENHFLAFNAQLDVGRHRKHPIEDFEDYTLGATFVLDVDDFTSANASASHSRSHGQRGDIDDPGQQLSTDIQFQNEFSVGISRAVPDGLEADATFSIAKVSFEDNGPIDNSDRWRTDYGFSGRLGWEIEQGTSVFIAPAATLTRFRRKLDNFGTNRDFDDYQLAAGIRLDPSPITFLEFLAGVTHRRFADEVFKNTTDRLVRGTFLWNPTSVMTVNGSVDQSFSPAASVGVSGTLTRTYSTSVDWTPWDPLILSASAAYRTEEFEDAVPARARDSIILGLSADWAIDRNFYTSISATTEQQNGDLDADDMTENRVQVRLGGQL
ncbi:MAG: outer membrane beta-barrel protein [Alphaproteobacteria bacterium]|nr:outer membrane beta-barrel protein [Alphaproteobacteria bacterium]